MNKTFLKTFRQPGTEFRGAPFWAWNGALEPDELRRQIRLMHRMGLGGFFMHSRVGLNTAYLSDEWFECVKACVDEADKLDMKAWLYDEDRWPSGAAGGLVTRNPAYRARRVRAETIADPARFAWTPQTVAAFVARLDGPIARQVRALSKTGARPRLDKGETIVRFAVEIDACSDWYNGQTYLDTLNHAAVREFIKVTHERYRKEIGARFGKRVPGIFTDEPNHGRFLSFPGQIPRPQAPWTEALPAVFKRRYGYDLLPKLMDVFFDVDGLDISKTRWQFHDCVTHLFVDAFARQIGEWCEKNGLQHTGHVLAEETPGSQSCLVGNALRFYEHMQAPGMDILTEHRREYDTAKGVSSVARQFGRKWRLTETYGCTGWDFPFLGHKAIGDWQVALGINLRCQHLAWYSMEGEAKRDYPASIFYQSPWWETYRKVEDYFARVHAVMTRGREVRDLLVIWPIESVWVANRMTTGPDPKIERMDTELIALRDSLLVAALDFDYGDEDIMARHGRVRRERDGAPRLRVAQADYKAVLVPRLTTIRSSTLRLLQRFKAAGGTVVFAGAPPAHVDAEPSPAAAAFAATCPRVPQRGPAVAAAVEQAARRIAIADGDGKPLGPTLHLLREDKDAYYLFVCNTGEGRGQGDTFRIAPRIATPSMIRDKRAAFPDVRIRGLGDANGRPLELDPDSGAVYTARAARRDGAWEIRTSLPPQGSRLFVVPKRASRSALPPERKAGKLLRRTKLAPKDWDIRLSESNVLVLDRPRYRVGTRPWKSEEEILRVDTHVREALGIPPRGGRMVQPWARTKSAKPKRIGVTLQYAFGVETMPGGPLFLALERPDTFAVSLNGRPVAMDAESGWWCDRSLRKIPLDPALLRPGRNELTLTCDYAENHPGLEIAYLLGPFGVRLNGTDATLVRLPARLAIGDWTRHGLPFYSGSVGYARTIAPKLRKGERLYVQIPDYRGVGLRVRVNGVSAGVIAWEPNELDITDLLAAGTNRLEIEVLGHRRNSHGPLHHAKRWHYWTGPGQFKTRDREWSDAYSLVPCGLMAPPVLAIKK